LPPRILVCPDKFKGSLTAEEAAAAIVRGIRRVWPEAEIDVQPLADGGEGSLELMADRSGLSRRKVTVRGPLRRPIHTEYLLGNGRALIETARACGLHLVPPPRRHPKNTTTLGVGMLIEDALARGARDITLFLGGSATNDAGAGMAAALGYRFYGASGEDFIPMADSLGYVTRIDASHCIPALGEAKVTAVCDVDNPLLGSSGATYTYAKQKGAPTGELPELERQMMKFGECILRDLGSDIRFTPGGGAAGGLGAGALAFLNGRLKPGNKVIPDLLDVPERAQRADLLITGEGKIDRQTAHGKVIAGVLGYNRPTIAVCGASEVGPDDLGLRAILAIDRLPEVSRESGFLHAAEHVERLVANYLREHYPKAD
jgi:glycerate kinase